MSLIGPSRLFSATQQFSRFRSEADIQQAGQTMTVSSPSHLEWRELWPDLSILSSNWRTADLDRAAPPPGALLFCEGDG
jgi:hypothetical protein